MTDTPDVQKIAEETIAAWKHGALNDGLLSTNDLRSLAAAVLSAVEPVIRRDEREQAAERIKAHATKHFPKGDLASDVEHARWRGRMHLDIAARVVLGPMSAAEAAEAFAAAIARSHATEEKPNG